MRRDTPPFIRDAQMGMIKVLAKAPNSEAFRHKISDSVEVLRGYVEKLMKGDMDRRDLIIAKQLSKHPSKYAHDVLQAIAAKQLIKAGMEVSAGQTVRYLIMDAQNQEAGKHVKAAELIDDGTPFDGKKYVDMLILAATNILSLFGYTEEKLKARIFYGKKQTVLKPAIKI